MKKEFPYKRILVIDDNETDFFLAHTHIKNHCREADLFFAMDVDSGLKMFKSFKKDEKPDLILLDLNFDRQLKQGMDFISEFQKLPKESTAATKVMVITAYSGYNEGKTLDKTHPDLNILEKPFTIEKLLSKTTASFS